MANFIKIVHAKEYKNNIFEIYYGIHSTPFGQCFAAVCDVGIISLLFTENYGSNHFIAELQKYWTLASFTEDKQRTEKVIQAIFEPQLSECVFVLIVNGTDFQQKVWQALISIQTGTTISYAEVADMIGQPKAVRATASAIARNHIAYLIPCHRVISKSGDMNKYRWGSELKKSILFYEADKKGLRT